jgi:hypothetical protein
MSLLTSYTELEKQYKMLSDFFLLSGDLRRDPKSEPIFTFTTVMLQLRLLVNGYCSY